MKKTEAKLRDGVVAGIPAKALVKPDDIILACEWSDRAGTLFVIAMDAGVVAVPAEMLAL